MPVPEGSPPKVIYIAGYGRSGSTVLAALLGAHPAVASVGELSFLFDEWAAGNRVCSCGAAYGSCEFWGEARRALDPDPEVVRLVRRVEHVRSLPRLLAHRLPEPERRRYREVQGRIFRYAAGRAGARVVVDSSKSATLTAGRYYALGRVAGLDVYVVHLVRDGVTSLETHVASGSNWTLEGHLRPRRITAIRALAGWLWANGCASLVGRATGPRRYLLVRYEDLLADPAGTLGRIGALVGLDFEPVVSRVRAGEAFGFGHMVGGNRVRFAGRTTLQAPDPRARGARLTPGQRALFTALGGWLNRCYGYR